MPVLIREPTVIATEFDRTVRDLCEPLTADFAIYTQHAQERLLPLDRDTIARLLDRLEYIKRRINDILDTVKNYGDTHIKLSNQEIGNLIESSWRMIEWAELAAEKLLEYTSYRMQYFPNTFAILESLPLFWPPPHYYRKLEILEIAARERDAAIQREMPRILQERQRFGHKIGGYDIRIASTLAFWEDQKEPLFAPEYGGFQEFTHTALSMDIDHREVVAHTAILWKSAIEKALTQRDYLHQVYKILDRFSFEESELMSRLRIWFEMRGMYRPIKIEELL